MKTRPALRVHRIEHRSDPLSPGAGTSLQVREDFAVVGRNQSGRVARIILNHILYYQYLMHSSTSRVIQGHFRTLEVTTQR